MEFGDRLKAFRETRKLTQAQVRTKLHGVPTPTYQGWESKTRTPPEWLQALILEALETGSFPPAKKGFKSAGAKPKKAQKSGGPRRPSRNKGD